MAPTSGGTLVVLFEPYPHVLGVSSVATIQARVGRPSHRKSAQGTVQDRLAAAGASGRPDPAAVLTLRHELHTAWRIHVVRQVLEDLGAGHQETPAVQHFGVRSLEVVVLVAIGVAEQAAVDVSEAGDSAVVQGVGPGVAAKVLELLGEGPDGVRIVGVVHREDRVVRGTTWLFGFGRIRERSLVGWILIPMETTSPEKAEFACIKVKKNSQKFDKTTCKNAFDYMIRLRFVKLNGCRPVIMWSEISHYIYNKYQTNYLDFAQTT